MLAYVHYHWYGRCARESAVQPRVFAHGPRVLAQGPCVLAQGPRVRDQVPHIMLFLALLVNLSPHGLMDFPGTCSKCEGVCYICIRAMEN